MAGKAGQTRDRQLDGLADIGAALAAALDQPMDALWAMRNGYALCTQQGLAAIAGHLRDLGEPARDELRCLLRMGVHRDVEVTDGDGPPYQSVSQAFCSALPVAYSALPAPQWQPFAQLVLEAAYEATLLAALLNAHRGASSIVLLTRLGGALSAMTAGGSTPPCTAPWRRLLTARSMSASSTMVRRRRR